MADRKRTGRLRLFCRADLCWRDRGEARAQEWGFFFRDSEAAGGPWDVFLVPFLFSTNGRPYLKQIETESGIWFRDAQSHQSTACIGRLANSREVEGTAS
jgi:hypothetical protein